MVPDAVHPLISSARVQPVATITMSDDPTAANAAKELAGLLTKETGREVKVLSDLEVGVVHGRARLPALAASAFRVIG